MTEQRVLMSTGPTGPQPQHDVCRQRAPGEVEAIVDARIRRGLPQRRDPETRIALDEQVRCTLISGEQTWGYLQSFRLSDGTWNVWTHRDGATSAIQIERV